ncbi:MAG: cyclic nucleotide-binding domain-containing protein [Anaerolineales bacterium]|nr:cyclic nucleotide-binding domain-containing protein [Anaerolineales bacterium]
MKSDVLNQLQKTAIFKNVSDDILAEVAIKASTRKLAKDEVLIRKGEKGDSLFLIHDGWVKIVTVDSKGDELIINKCGPGETIGEMALLDGETRSATVIALTESEVLELKQDVFEEILKQRSDVPLAIIRSYSERLRFSTTYIEKAIDWSQKTAEGDYSFVEQIQPLVEGAGSNDDKAAQLLSAFFAMVRRVKEREDGLKQQLEKLTFEIDQARRKQEFDEITSTEFYANLKEQARALRQKRAQG